MLFSFMPNKRKSYWSVSEIAPPPLNLDGRTDRQTDEGQLGIRKAPLPLGIKIPWLFPDHFFLVWFFCLPTQGIYQWFFIYLIACHYECVVKNWQDLLLWFDLIECFMNTFLHTHSWLSCVDEDDDEDEVGLKEKPEDTRYIKKSTSK